MKTFKRILFLVAIASLSLVMASSSNGGHDPDFREIELRFAVISIFGGLQDGLQPNQLFNPIKEPNDFDFQPTIPVGSTSMDVVKILRDVPYGSNNLSGSNGTTYYYMHGGSGIWDCIDKDNVENAVDPSDRSSVFLTLDIALAQEVWGQIMSQCHGTNFGSGNNVSGRGFWYKSEEYLNTTELATAVEYGIDLDFLSQNITNNCTDYVNEEYGCDSWDAGSICEGC